MSTLVDNNIAIYECEETEREYTITYSAYIYPAEPGVGCMSPYTDDWEITKVEEDRETIHPDNITPALQAKLDQAVQDCCDQDEPMDRARENYEYVMEQKAESRRCR